MILKPRSNKNLKKLSWQRRAGWAVLVCLLLLLAPVTSVWAADPPTIIGYQGRLADSDGDLLGGAGTAYYFKISFWNSATVGAGTKLWPTAAPTAFTSTVRHGLFNINIGDTTGGYPDALDYDFSTNSNIYLQIEVSADGVTYETLSPRQPITSSAFAQLAGAVSGSGASTMGSVTVSGHSSLATASSTDLTVSNALYLPTLNSTFLAVDENGLLVATTTIPGTATWGSITGTLSDQTDLQSALDGKVSISTTSMAYLSDLTGLAVIGSSTGQTTILGSTQLSSLTATGQTSLANASTTNLTVATNAYLTSLASTYLAVDTTGKIIATTSPTLSESDPVFTASFAFGIASSTNWDTAFNWGDHASAGYLAASSFNGLFDTRLEATTSLPYLSTLAGLATIGSSTGQTTILGKTVTTNASTTNLTIATDAYLTALASTYLAVDTTGKIIATTSPTLSESDPVFTASFAFGIASSTNWDTAFDWGNHASAGYLTNLTGGLDAVLGNASTTNLTISGTGYLSSLASTFLAVDATGKIVATTTTSFSAGMLAWATTTSEVAGQILIYPKADTDILLVGGSSTSTAKFVLNPNTGEMTFGTVGSAADSTLKLGSDTSYWNIGKRYADGSFGIASSTALGTSNYLTLTSVGQFGLGTTSPSNILEVLGNTYLAGNLTATGTLAISGSAQVASLTTSGHSTLATASSTNLTISGTGYLSSLASTLLAVDATGKIIATSTGVGGEVDPVFTASFAFGIASSTNWDTAFDWGDHASAGYLAASSFNGLFDTRLEATTSLPYLSTLAGLATIGSSTGQTTILGKTVTTNASTTNLTIATDAYLTALASTYLAVDTTGKIIATTTPGGAAVWGSITGTLSSQTDLQSALDGKVSISTTSMAYLSDLTGLAIIGSSTGQTTILGKTILTNASTTNLSVSDQTYLTGNVGIGTTTPSSALVVNGTGYFTSSIIANNRTLIGYDSNLSASIGGGFTAGNYNINSPNGINVSDGLSGLPFKINGVTVATISRGGNLGVGSSTLSNRLEISGNTFLGGNLTATGTLAIGGHSTLATASSTDLTISSNAYLSSLASTMLAVDATGKIIATSTGVGGETDPVFTASFAFGIASSTNWDTAFDWGDHASAGYLAASSFNGLFDTRLEATTSLPYLSTLAGLATIGSSTGQTTILGKTVTTNASTTNLTIATDAYLTALASTYLAVDTTGKVIATTTPISSQWTTLGSNIYYNTGNVGIGTTTPYAKLTVAGQIVGEYFTSTSTTATSTFAGNVLFGSGGFTYDYAQNLTSIDNIELGVLNFITDAGIVSWVDLPISDSSPANTVHSYTAQMDGNALLTLYSEADGSGGILYPAVGVGTTSPFARLAVTGVAGQTRPLFQVASSTNNAYLTLTSSGQLGLGTTSPSNILEVLGNTYLAGNLTATGTLAISGHSTLATASSTNLTISGSTYLTALSSTYLAVDTTGKIIATTTPGGAAVWGSITGTLSSQTDLQSALDGKVSISTTSMAYLSDLTGLAIIGSSTGQTTILGQTTLTNASTTNLTISGTAYLSSLASTMLAVDATGKIIATSTGVGGEVDPVFTASFAFGIASSTNWDTAFDWGDHASAGYLAASSFNGLFDTRLEATTSLPYLSTLAGLATIGSSTGQTTILGKTVTTNASTTNLTVSNTLTLGSALAVSSGGTGLTAYTTGDLLYASGPSSLNSLAGVAAGHALLSAGEGEAPAWGKIDLTNHISGTLPYANGGTGTTTWAAGGIVFATSTFLSQDAGNFYWDSVNKRLGVGSSTPLSTLSVSGTAGTNPFTIASSTGNTMFTITNRGYLGVGTANPDPGLHIVSNGLGDGVGTSMVTLTQYSSDAAGGSFIAAKGRGTFYSPSAVQAGDDLFALHGRGQMTNGAMSVSNSASIKMVAGETYTTTAKGAYITFSTTPNGSATRYERLRVGADGNIGIGTTGANKLLEINHATGGSLRLTYNDSNGSATNYTDFSVGSDGALTINTSNSATTSISNGLTVNGSSLVVQKATGSVGIGTTTPSHKITLAEGTTPQDGILFGDISLYRGSAGSLYTDGTLFTTGSLYTTNFLIGPGILGGLGAGDDLTIESTSDATKGDISIAPNGGAVSIGSAASQTTILGQTVTTNASTTNLTISGTGYLSSLGSTFLAVDTTGKIIATTTPILSVSATGLELSGSALTLTSGYLIPLSASTTNWNTFYDTPSNRITAGTGLSWSSNTLNFSTGMLAWATTTSEVAGQILIYAKANTDLLVLGGSSTSTAKFVLDPNTSELTVGVEGGSEDALLEFGSSTAYWALGKRVSDGSFGIASTSALGSSNYLTILGNGKIGIGSSTPSALLTVKQAVDDQTGGIWVSASDSDYRAIYMNTSQVMNFQGGAGNTATLNAVGEWTNASDQSYKERIEDLNYGLEEIMQLQPRRYHVIGSIATSSNVGFIAQELEQIIPEVVSGEEGSKGVSYGNLVTVAIKAIQDLGQALTDLGVTFVDGAARFVNLAADRVTTKELCVGETCVTETELKALLQSANVSGSTPLTTDGSSFIAPSPTDNTSSTSTPTATSTATSTEPTTDTATSTEPVAEPVETATSTEPVIEPVADTTASTDPVTSPTEPVSEPTPIDEGPIVEEPAPEPDL